MEHDHLTYAVIGCAMEVHTFLGNGFQEVIYQRCLAIEMEKAGIPFQRELPQTIFYKEFKVGTRRADFIVEGTLVLELKAQLQIEGSHLAQVMNYVQAYNMDRGLLINFGAKSLEYKLIFSKEEKERWRLNK